MGVSAFFRVKSIASTQNSADLPGSAGLRRSGRYSTATVIPAKAGTHPRPTFGRIPASAGMTDESPRGLREMKRDRPIRHGQKVYRLSSERI